jgi:arginase family enzyme
MPTVCSIDLSVIKSSHFPGVSLPSPAAGLDAQEAMEIMHILGKEKTLRVLAITEYNPAIEKIKSGRLVVELIKAFLNGLSERL